MGKTMFSFGFWAVIIGLTLAGTGRLLGFSPTAGSLLAAAGGALCFIDLWFGGRRLRSAERRVVAELAERRDG